MRRNVSYVFAVVMGALSVWQTVSLSDDSAEAAHGWEGKRRVSYQHQQDLFYNYYAHPGPYGSAAAQLYVSPQPVPAFVGHTYVSYQPLMPHEFLYRHQRAYYTYNRGSGWTRTNVRYGTSGTRLKNCCIDMRWPMTLGIWAVNEDLYHPGVRF